MYRIRNQTGSVVTIVLIFSTCAFISVATYFFSQYRLRKRAIQRPLQLQSLLAARSGILLGVDLINKSRIYDNQTEIDPIDDPFGFGLFEEEDEFSDEEELAIGGEPITLFPFTDTGFGVCTLQVKSAGNYLQLRSVGHYSKKSSQVSATLGSVPFISPDTVLYLEVAGIPEGGSVSGMVTTISLQGDSGKPSGYTISHKDLKESIDQYQSQISIIDSGLQHTPLTISDNDELDELPEKIEGSLSLDGQFIDLHWKSESTFVILGDLQTVGDVVIEDVELIVEGEVKLFDKTTLKNVTIFSQNTVFLANQSQFQGQITSQGDIEIYDDAVVAAPSCIVAAGTPKKKDAEAEGTDEKFTLYVRNRATVDAVLISASDGGGILTEAETVAKGILWAAGRVCHQGQLQGIIRAKCLVSEENPFLTEKNVMQGAVEPLERVSHYVFPFYVGDLSITAWKEGM